MNIVNYSSYFHDGSLIAIEHTKNIIVLSLESAEISPDENKDDIILSEHSTIKGKLHLEGVNKIYDNDREIFCHLKMLYDSGEILHLKIKNNCINLDLVWTNFPPHPDISAYSFYRIEAEKIWWENIPDLFDPGKDL